MPAFNQVIEAIERVADRFELDFQKKRKMGDEVASIMP